MHLKLYFKEKFINSNGKRLYTQYFVDHFLNENVVKDQRFIKILKHFKSGEQNIINELDINNIIDSIRKSNVIINILLTQRQQLFLKYQHSSVIYPEVKMKPNLAIIKGRSNNLHNEILNSDLNESFNYLINLIKLITLINDMIKELNSEEIDETTLKLIRTIFPPKNQVDLNLFDK